MQFNGTQLVGGVRHRGGWLVAALVAAAGCTGAIGAKQRAGNDDGASGRGDVPAGPGRVAVTGDPEAVAAFCADIGPPSALPAGMRRLTSDEIVNAVTDLLGGPAPSKLLALRPLASDPGRDDHRLTADETFVRSYHPAIAEAAQAGADRILKSTCTAGNAECPQAELLAIARRAWRQDLNAQLGDFIAQRLSSFTQELGVREGLSAALQLVLASPRFLYLRDVGSDRDEPATARLGGALLAGQISAAVWASVPDAELLDAAGRGELDHEDGLAAQVDRMLQDARAQRGLASFFRSWLGYNQVVNAVKNEQIYPSYDEAARADMLRDTEETLLALFTEDADTQALLTSPAGSPGEPTRKALGWTDGEDLATLGRHGLTTHPAILAVTSNSDETSIVKRGKFILERVLCGHVPDPPPGVDVDADEIREEAGRPLSNREVAELHGTDPACAGCHRHLDPFGIAFENYDPIGALRSESRGLPIDTRIDLQDAFGLTGSFAGAVELVDAIAASGVTQRCFAGRFANFVKPSAPTDAQACALSALTEDDAGQARSMKEIVRRFLLSDLFLERAAL